MRTFFIAAGHGGQDPGACALGTCERDELVKIVDFAVDLAKNKIPDDTRLVVVPHRYALFRTVRYINRMSQNPGHDLCLEVHLNSNPGKPGTGTETYYGHKQLAREIHEEAVKVLGLRDRGVKDGRYLYFNRNTRPASALIELGFINNPVDLDVVRATGALALAKGMVRACGGEWEDQSFPWDKKISIRELIRYLLSLLR